ncbi:MAG: BamA/TamA family outer membrane protein [Bergeyella sp.]
MSGKHIKKYLQKYYLFFFFATSLAVLYACSTTRKVPDGEFLLTKNSYEFEGEKLFADEIPSYVSQKPNKKLLYVIPFSLWMYNATNPKYDSILAEYSTYPNEVRNQKLRDSLFLKYNKPELVGKSLAYERFMQTLGQAPVILDQNKTETSSNSIRKFLVYRGYWDAETDYRHKLDSARKKAEVIYTINPKDATHIDGYYYDIPDLAIKDIYTQSLQKSIVKNNAVLDQTNLEKEVRRITENVKEKGYYSFNASGEEISFVADTLQSRKKVPLTLEIKKDSLNTPYKKTTIGNVRVFVVNKLADSANAYKDSLIRINIYKTDERYKTMALWRPVVLRPGNVYNQRDLDLTKRNFASMNNFSTLNYKEQLRKGSDSILDVTYFLSPLDKYNFRVATDINYSEILNFGISPSVDLTTRNVFGGAENLITSLSGTFGSVKNPKNTDKRILAYEVSAQTTLSFPKLLLPFKYYKVIPKRYSPISSIVLGASIQDNIGLGRIGFNAGLNYQANANDIVTHRLTVLNTQFSLTRNKEKYYDYFVGERDVVRSLHEQYFLVNPNVQQDFENNVISFDDVSSIILKDEDFVTNFNNSSQQNKELYNSFLQSLINKDRQTQDVLITSMIYNFSYSEIGKKDYKNPFYFNAKFEMAGNLIGFMSKKENEGLTTGKSKTMFGIPYSQFVKFDFDIRKYISFTSSKHVLVLRQFIGVGIPYGNSQAMPFIRSYFNGGSNDIRAWRVFGGLGPADTQIDAKVRAYIMDNVKLTTNIEYRQPFNDMFEGALFVDAGNIWSLKDNGYGDQFKFDRFIKQMGVGTGLGIRMNMSFLTVRLDAAYKVHDPNRPVGERWVINKWQPLKPVINFAIGYPF